MKHCILLILCGLLASSAVAQTLNGRVTDANGKPVAAASIYIQEQSKGLIANDKGEFQTRLPEGEYHLEISCLGYETDRRSIHIAGGQNNFVISLKNKDFQLPELSVRAGEDPAYEMMRRAIAKAPYYRQAVQKSDYEAYVKGSGKIVRMPELMNRMSKGEADMYVGKLFMQESFSEYQFIAPDSLRQNVIAYASTFPSMNDPQSALATGMVSLYHPTFGGAISPLNPRAFDYYRFRYEGYDEDNDQIINKIRIIPKRKDAKLLEGVIYLADDEWSVRSAELTLHMPVATLHYLQNYHRVVNDIYLITNYELRALFDVLGLEVEAQFLSSIQYNAVQVGDSLLKGQAADIQHKTKKKNLDLTDNRRIHPTADTLALRRDSAFWASVRTVVLNEEELGSYRRKDTIQAYTDSVARAEANPPFKLSNLLMGGTLGGDSSLLRMHYGGAVCVVKEFNFVDGFQLGQTLVFDWKRKRPTGWTFTPALHWAVERQTLLWQARSRFDYAPRRLGQLDIAAGRISEDFNGPIGASRAANSVFAFLGGYNYISFYDKTFLAVSNQLELANGLLFTLSAEYADRQPLTAHTNRFLFGIVDPPEPNVPEYDGDLNLDYNRLAQYGLRVQYTPEYYFRMREGRKHYVRSRFPTFALEYRQGLASSYLGGGSYSGFQQLEASVEQRLRLGFFNRFHYQLTAGRFFNQNPFNYVDYKHFAVSGYVTTKSFETSYALLPYYRFAAKDYWGQAFLNYNSDYLLLKWLPFFQGKLFTESLQAKLLHTNEKPFYTEWGYSVDGGMGAASVGVFVAFDRLEYQGVGVRASIPLLRASGDGSRAITISF
jgi:hypothetical protein